MKFALYPHPPPFSPTLRGHLDRIGLPRTSLSFRLTDQDQGTTLAWPGADFAAVSEGWLEWLAHQVNFNEIQAVAHRIVHGMRHATPQWISPALLDELHQISPNDPEHLPLELHLIELIQQRFPELRQLACFDTSFHQTMPRVARLLPIPRRFDIKGVQRYGFHGLSCGYLMEELERLEDRACKVGRVILAHLGNGASMTAVRDGASIDTSMGFTPASGLPMGTRAGNLDPSLASHFARTEGMGIAEFDRMIHRESGLLGMSETSSDMRDLLGVEASDVRAAEAIDCFCYESRKWIGALTAALGGLDTLVFAGGIGENCAEVRTRICGGLGHLGIQLDTTANAGHAGVISLPEGGVCVRVIHTDEEVMMARSLSRALAAP